MKNLRVGEASARIGLLNIPVELRLEIFRHFLHAEYVYKGAPFPRIELDTAILGVCRQARSEASKVLYEENQWILITGNWLGGGYGKYMQQSGLPVICPGAAKHIRDVALRIDITLDRASGDPGILETTAFAYSEETLHELCRTFWMDALVSDVDITLSLSEHAKIPRSVRHEKLLTPFAHVRGVRKAIIKGPSSKEQIEELEKVMQDGKWTWPQILERLTKDKQEGDARFKLGSYHKAEISYLRGVVFKDDLMKLVFPRHLRDEYPIWMNRFAATMNEIFNNHSLVASKLGKFRCAVESAKDALRFPGITDRERAKAHYRRGLGYIGLHNDTEAGKDFRYAQEIFPTNKAIQAQLRAVEKRLGKKVTDEMAPIKVILFAYGNLKEWRGDPRLIQVWGVDGVSKMEFHRLR
ncbi:peptidyl-prolyl cis-trans isomerase cpr6 [Hypocenomyce scalaris]|nr:peptidyl-prolyl cis-trans isomerase cpr6 [Hypocenomyce scalaris]